MIEQLNRLHIMQFKMYYSGVKWFVLFGIFVISESNKIPHDDHAFRGEDWFSNVETELREQRTLIKAQSRQIQELTTRLASLQTTTTCEETPTNVDSVALESNTTPPIQTYYQHSVSGCLYDILRLDCGIGFINVTNAVYGQYFLTCESGCCQPHPADDCTENVEENRESDWLYLKAVCDGENVCNFEYQGSVVYNCPTQEIADYMKIYYTCWPEQLNEAVAFTAYTAFNREYGNGALVQFEGTVTNIGNYFDPSSSTFLCPYAGLYMFAINIMSVQERFMYAQIMKDDEVLVTAQSDDITDTYNQASNLVFAECSPGQTIWVESHSCCGILYSTDRRYSTFSGAIVHRYS